MADARKTITWVMGALALVLVASFFGRDILLRFSSEIQCDDGLRRRIDAREFNTEYWAYAIDFEGSLSDKAKISGKLAPKQIQELSEAMQSAKEFNKFIVNGFNACAITKRQYASYGARFKAMDDLSVRIASLTTKTPLKATEHDQLSKMVAENIAIARGLAAAK